jgi:predicted ArsR family transcriptional regulator
MTQKERDRLVALKKAKKKLITQKQAAAEIGVSERQVRRMLRSLKERGDKAVIHAGRGRPSNRKLAIEVEQRAKHRRKADFAERHAYDGDWRDAVRLRVPAPCGCQHDYELGA